MLRKFSYIWGYVTTRSAQCPSIELVKSVKVHRRGTKVVAWEMGGGGGESAPASTRSRGLALSSSSRNLLWRILSVLLETYIFLMVLADYLFNKELYAVILQCCIKNELVCYSVILKNLLMEYSLNIIFFYRCDIKVIINFNHNKEDIWNKYIKVIVKCLFHYKISFSSIEFANTIQIKYNFKHVAFTPHIQR